MGSISLGEGFTNNTLATIEEHDRVMRQCWPNELLRQYFPKDVDLCDASQARLNPVELNERPGKTLDFETPAGRFQQAVALTV
jgi:IS30 family transposase